MKMPRLLALIVTTGLMAAPAAAAIQIYTDQAAFLAALQPGYYLETFDNLMQGNLDVSSMNFSGSGFGFRASTSGGNLFGVDIAGDGALALGLSAATFTIDSLSGPTPITALGGYFFFDDNGGGTNSNEGMRITATDGTLTATHDLAPPISMTTFVGFISDDSPLNSLSFWRTTNVGVPDGWPTTNDFIMGTASREGVIPEPGTLVIWGLLGATFSIAAWRRRRIDLCLRLVRWRMIAR